MKINGQVGGARRVPRCLDVADRAPFRQIGDVTRYVVPAFSAVARELYHAIVRARPDQALLSGRFGDSKQSREIFDADVVAGEAAGETLLALVVGSQIGTDGLPALPGIGGLVHVLAADIKLVGIVRRDS